MCAQCRNIETKTEHFRKMKTVIMDRQTLNSIDGMIAGLEARKAALHPEPNAIPRAVSWPRPH
jgi:hypothetical protein